MVNVNKQLTFIYQPNILRRSEANFFQSLKNNYPDSQTVNDHFLVPQCFIDKLVDTNHLYKSLQADTMLPPKKRLACLDILDTCPPQMRVALHPKEISFDVVAQVDGQVFYWEYHEKQHARLSNSRPKHIYTPNGDKILVPRYFQRLIRDVWRVVYFRPYTVVWQDWFEKEENTNECLELRDGYREFNLLSKFSFENLISL